MEENPAMLNLFTAPRLPMFIAALGMFQFGYHTGVINVPQKVLEDFIAQVFKNTTYNKQLVWSIVVSIFAIGGMIGGYMAPMGADRIGRRNSLWFNNLTALIAISIISLTKLTNSVALLIIGRFLIGINCGASTSLVPMYLSEIATKEQRGAFGIVGQLAVTIGLLISQILGNENQWGTSEKWPNLFLISYVPIAFQFFILPLCPESPRHLLLNRNQESKTQQALTKLRNTSNIQSEMDEMKAEARAQEEEIRTHGGPVKSVFELFRYPWLREPLMIAIVMQLSQQLSGINAVFYYSTAIFTSANLNQSSAEYATMGVGVIMVVMSLISIPLIDRLGRRTLHLTGLGGMFCFSVVLTISLVLKNNLSWLKYVSVASVLLYTLFFATGPGSLPWMITSELFTQAARPAAVSVAVLINWFTNFVVGLTFPFILSTLDSYIFLPYAIIMAIMWTFIFYRLPETKNRTFEEISLMFKRDDPSENKRMSYGTQKEAESNP